ncbi:4-oxalomesaconate tautomerase [Brevibacterium oceani]|uniref:4-oxalomesaconate tautomerase n=1 Tax=Brevibacterium oceani TaxID=358099 RepID=UPI001FE7CD32|nr:4-oxalomesaconate tautomerase [Brevibacterium oceani]
MPALFMRGGTSRGAFFYGPDLPDDIDLRDRVLLAVMGSPHPLQIDGLGGGHPLTSKVGIVSASDADDVDLDFTFAQLQPESTEVQTRANCGNMLAAVVPFAVEIGLIVPVEDLTTVTVRTLNTGLVAEIAVHTPSGPHGHRVVEFEGDTPIDGVNGTGSPISILFRDTAGSIASSLLPTGQRRDELSLPDGTAVEATLIDNGQPVALLRASDLGIEGTETPEALEANTSLTAAVEHLRLQAGELMGLGDVTDKSYPKMTLVSAPSPGAALTTRSFIPHTVHRSIGVLAALTVATAACMDDTVAAEMAQPGTGSARTLHIDHPSGSFPVELRLDGDTVTRSGLTRTARTLMAGSVFVPRSVWAGYESDSAVSPIDSVSPIDTIRAQPQGSNA